jgi:pimeloyl-ACP methyl ester carboxylesterase
MTLFIDLRATPSGGICATEATVWDEGRTLVATDDFLSRIQGRDLILATHGFNVSRADGIKALSSWDTLCQLPPSALFIGVLWPGDSRYLPVLDYPFEGNEAITSGQLLARFLNQNANSAASVSLVSHSLGARMILEALAGLQNKVRRLIIMAGAIENDCLTREYQSAAVKAEEIYVIASKQDWVLEFAFPTGNLIGEILMHGHPYCKVALGRNGPAIPIPLTQRGGAWQIPADWKYGHLDYLPSEVIGHVLPPPIIAPGESSTPTDSADGWKPAWSASAVATQVK